jgi:hypothetical protein
MLKGREKHTQARKSVRIDGVRGIFETDTPRMTAQRLVNKLVSVLYTCHSGMQLYRTTSVVEMATVTIDMIRSNHTATESILKRFFQL